MAPATSLPHALPHRGGLFLGRASLQGRPRQMRRSPERLTGLLTPLATIVG